jgi:drug/metabolite transporter (DMT)-like permease
LLAFAISLASGLSWGVSDFLGGLFSRRIHVLTVLAVSQPVGLVVALALLPAVGAASIPFWKLVVAFAAGFFSFAGLAAFYRAMALGTMSVVAPIAATGVAVPVAFGIARGELPGPAQVVGLGIAIVGVVVLGYEEGSEGAPEATAASGATRASILLALVSALGFGLFFTGIDLAAVDPPGLAIVAARVGGVTAVGIALLVVRPPLRPAATALGALAAMGVFDVTANFLFAIASTKGILPVVAVGGSMYPAFTIALAHLVLGEKLIRAQQIGVAAALAGVILIAAGG